jgi:hypothetical protein
VTIQPETIRLRGAAARRSLPRCQSVSSDDWGE